jgi:threonine/homoserine/homoserine lactone efflux protein
LVQGFLEGLVIGFSIAAPVGPIGLLCIQRTLDRGRKAGLVSGLGAATADATYASIAGFGVTFVSSFLVNEQLWIRLVGGAFLIFLGLRTFFSVPRDSAISEGRKRLANDYASTFALTLSNPLTIVSFAAVFTGLGLLGQARDYWAATELVSGVFAGSALWWIVLSTSVGTLRGKLSPGRMRWVNRLSGVVISGFGAVAILSLVI